MDEHVFLKVALMRGVMRIGKKGKMSPRFIGPFEIFERIGHVAYNLVLPPPRSYAQRVPCMYVAKVHPKPHSSYIAWGILTSKGSVLRWDPCQDYSMWCNKEIPLAKILWGNHQDDETTLNVRRTWMKFYSWVLPA